MTAPPSTLIGPVRSPPSSVETQVGVPGLTSPSAVDGIGPASGDSLGRVGRPLWGSGGGVASADEEAAAAPLALAVSDDSAEADAEPGRAPSAAEPATTLRHSGAAPESRTPLAGTRGVGVGVDSASFKKGKSEATGVRSRDGTNMAESGTKVAVRACGAVQSASGLSPLRDRGDGSWLRRGGPLRSSVGEPRRCPMSVVSATVPAGETAVGPAIHVRGLRNGLRGRDGGRTGPHVGGLLRARDRRGSAGERVPAADGLASMNPSSANRLPNSAIPAAVSSTSYAEDAHAATSARGRPLSCNASWYSKS